MNFVTRIPTLRIQTPHGGSLECFMEKIKSRDHSRLWGTKLCERCRYLAGGVVLAGLLAGGEDLGVVPEGRVPPPVRGAGGEMPDCAL